MRRRLACLLLLPVLFGGVAACGDGGGEETAPTPSGSGSTSTGSVSGVTVTGAFGSAPTVQVDAPLKLDATGSSVAVTGNGPVVAKNKQALLHLTLVNGRTGKKAVSTYDTAAPQAYPMTDGQVWPALISGIVGKPQGSRVVIASTPADAFGTTGAQQYGISGTDPVVFVVDVLSVDPAEVLDGPEGTSVDPPAGLPAVVEKDGTVTGVDADADADAEPSKTLKVVPLIEGTGPPARDDSLVTFNYLGQIYGTSKVFDESFSKQPVTFPLGTGGLIKAWDEGLVGVKRGSRVLIVAPPESGYGPAGNPEGGIKGTDTLVFVVDILGVS